MYSFVNEEACLESRYACLVMTVTWMCTMCSVVPITRW